MYEKSNIIILFGSGSSAVNVPFYSDIAYSHTSAISDGTSADISYKQYDNDKIYLFEHRIFNIYNYDDQRLNINYWVEDIKKERNILNTSLSGHCHDTLTIPDDVVDFRIHFTFTYDSLSADRSVVSFHYKIEDYDGAINQQYYKGTVLTQGLSPKRNGHLLSNGLGIFGVPGTESFSILPYVPYAYYSNSGASQFFSYLESVFSEKINTVSQLKLFGSEFDDLVIKNIKNYGIKCDALQNDYIRMNLLINRSMLKNIHDLWVAKGSIYGLHGALKLFANVFPYALFDQTETGWYLTEASGGRSYSIFDLDIEAWASLSASEFDVDDVIYAIDARDESALTTEGNPRYGLKLSHFIDPWNKRNNFSSYDSVSALINNYEYGNALVDSLVYISEQFAPINTKLYYYWVTDANTRVELYIN